MAHMSSCFDDPPRGNESMHSLLMEKQRLMTLMQSEGYDLSKFELVAVPEEFSDASGADQIGHGGLLEYDGVLDVMDNSDSDSDDSEMSGFHHAEEFNITIEHVADDLGHPAASIHLLDIQDHQAPTALICDEDILEIGIQANDLNSLLEQFEECEQPKKRVEAKMQLDAQSANMIVKTDRVQQDGGTKPVKTQKQLPNPAEIVKKIAPVKRKTAILLDTQALPIKKTRVKMAQPLADTTQITPIPEVKRTVPNAEVKTTQSQDIKRAISHARKDTSSPVPFNLKTLISTPKYLSMEHDYCLSPACSEKSNASDLGLHMSKEERRAYYKNKYKVKKKGQGFDSPVACSSPASMSPVGESCVGLDNEDVHPGDKRKVPAAAPPAVPCPEPVPLFDKIPDYFSNKLLVGMYKEIDKTTSNQVVHQGFDEGIFVANNDVDAAEKRASQPENHPQSRMPNRRRRCVSLRKAQFRRNSLSSESDSSYCSSCSEQSLRKRVRRDSCNGERSRNRQRRGSRGSVHSVTSRSRSRSRSLSRSRSCSSHDSYDSRGRSRSRERSYSRSRSRSYSRSRSLSRSRSRSLSSSRSRSFSRSRSRSYSRSRSRSRSYSRARSRSLSHSRSRSRSRSVDYSRQSRAVSRSPSRSPRRSKKGSSRRRSMSRSQRRGGWSRTVSRSRHRARERESKMHSSRHRTFDPNAGNSDVKYTDEQLQEFSERRVVYVGSIDQDTTKKDLVRQFSKFGAVAKIALHFREDRDSYGFVTFHYKCDAIAAIAAGNDPSGPQYDLCFGGRRTFCKTNYEDLDSLNKASEDMDFGYNGDRGRRSPDRRETDFDKLLKAAMKGQKR